MCDCSTCAYREAAKHLVEQGVYDDSTASVFANALDPATFYSTVQALSVRIDPDRILQRCTLLVIIHQIFTRVLSNPHYIVHPTIPMTYAMWSIAAFREMIRTSECRTRSAASILKKPE